MLLLDSGGGEMLRILFPEFLVPVRKPRLAPGLCKQEKLGGVTAPGVITSFLELVYVSPGTEFQFSPLEAPSSENKGVRLLSILASLLPWLSRILLHARSSASFSRARQASHPGCTAPVSPVVTPALRGRCVTSETWLWIEGVRTPLPQLGPPPLMCEGTWVERGA